MNSIHKAILKTLVYADIFKYPLTTSEIHHWLIWQNSAQPPSQKNIILALENIKSISKTPPYFYLKNHQKNISLRQQHQHFSQPKLKLAHQAANYLKLIPFINLIAVTGALAMNNSDKNDDIDLIIITQSNKLWLTRVLAIFILELFHLRRRPKTQTINNKICLNLFLDEFSLKIPPVNRNLFTAHEICQLKPIYNKQNTYQKFLHANSWTKKYLTHAITIKAKNPRFFPSNTSFYLLNLLELLAFKLQYIYMKSKITNEKINKHFAFFHPRPTGKILLQQYQTKLKQFKII